MQDKFEQKNRRLWTENEYKNIEKFIKMHIDCGLFVKLELIKKEEVLPPQLPEIKIPIKAHKINEPTKIKLNLKLRGKRM